MHIDTFSPLYIRSLHCLRALVYTRYGKLTESQSRSTELLSHRGVSPRQRKTTTCAHSPSGDSGSITAAPACPPRTAAHGALIPTRGRGGVESHGGSPRLGGAYGSSPPPVPAPALHRDNAPPRRAQSRRLAVLQAGLGRLGATHLAPASLHPPPGRTHEPILLGPDGCRVGERLGGARSGPDPEGDPGISPHTRYPLLRHHQLLYLYRQRE